MNINCMLQIFLNTEIWLIIESKIFNGSHGPLLLTWKLSWHLYPWAMAGVLDITYDIIFLVKPLEEHINSHLMFLVPTLTMRFGLWQLHLNFDMKDL